MCLCTIILNKCCGHITFDHEACLAASAPTADPDDILA